MYMEAIGKPLGAVSEAPSAFLSEKGPLTGPSSPITVAKRSGSTGCATLSTRITRVHHHTQSWIIHESRGLNSGPHTWKANILLTELSHN